MGTPAPDARTPHATDLTATHGTALPTPPRPLAGGLWRGLRVGLFGGSFNPAHGGHRHMSLMALRMLGLDEVWWLVSPQNPLKSLDGMAPLTQRMAGAARVANHPRIRVSDIETRMGTRYTVDTLAGLKRHFPGTDFVWLMGADNLAQMPRWRGWTRIFGMVPVAIFPRQPYSVGALGGKAARRFAKARWQMSAAKHLAGAKAPAWVFLEAPLHPASATAIRCQGGAGGVDHQGRIIR
ncbi:nicotinate-nucleotide adenylyltransferase [Niveispirillum sp. SYP-B3756]|uniref:nicotinate-nucleotide adenylyltransferase n=1 Tax=Niveispirillum sp. SYP-B3756 TaxID=2662178 RepID=UPI0012922452|nr:nicotinate-nucleotide adenylyltransferase [Niveispirillum sp. SYP-B3756]MQP65399.1 nicotinate-nucleotide adenylyltransferase [Niveispirillum sp. SYP-B3756]